MDVAVVVNLRQTETSVKSETEMVYIHTCAQAKTGIKAVHAIIAECIRRSKIGRELSANAESDIRTEIEYHIDCIYYRHFSCCHQRNFQIQRFGCNSANFSAQTFKIQARTESPCVVDGSIQAQTYTITKLHVGIVGIATNPTCGPDTGIHTHFNLRCCRKNCSQKHYSQN